MTKCQNCGYQNLSSDSQCYKCKSSLNTSLSSQTNPNRCQNCGYQNLSSDSQCYKCKYDLNVITNKNEPPSTSVLSGSKNVNMRRKIHLEKLDYAIIFLGLLILLSFLIGILSLFSYLFFMLIILFIYKIRKNVMRKNRLKLIDSLKHFQITSFDGLDGHEFEEILKKIFQALDFKVERTKLSRDYGVDLIMKSNAEKIGVQAKCYTSKVSLDAVQEIVAGLSYYGLNEGWVITNNYFTESAKNLARTNNIRLIDRDGLYQCVKDAYTNTQKSSIN